MNTFTKSFTTLAVATSCWFSTTVHAAVVSIAGDDLIFTYDDATLFGSANVVGNSIFFLPTNFLAQSLNGNGGAGAVQVTDIVDIDITVKAGSSFLMDNFVLVESGDYKLVGSGTSASAEAFLQITSFTQTCGILTLCNMANTFSAGTLNNQSGNLEQWSLNGALDLDNNANWGDDFHVNVRIQNTLDATSTSNLESALIQKKFGAIGVAVVSEVPVPASAWLFGSALIGLLKLKRSK